MNNETQSKFAAILAAQQQKAIVKTTFIPAPIPQPKQEIKLPDPVKEVIPEPEPLPEMSDMTINDLLNEPQQPETNDLQLIDYSPKAFAIIGKTKVIKDQLKQLGGTFNNYLKCGPGWIFSKRHLETVKQYLAV